MKRDMSRSSSHGAGSFKTAISNRTLSSRRSQRPRPTEDEMVFEPSIKCKCDQCQMHSTDKQVLRERERLDNNESKVLRAVEDEMDNAIRDLGQLVRFKSVSVQPEQLLESCRALDWVANRLADLKFKIYEHSLPNKPTNCFIESHQKVLFAKYFSSPTKNTLLIYAHLDVLPVNLDGWLSDPFELTAMEGKLYGRGVTSGKGMLVGWIQAIECWLNVHEDLPVNVKFIVDMLHEVGSPGLQDYVKARSDFFLDVDFMLFDVNSWVNNARPVVPCSLTGWAHFGVQVVGANKSLDGDQAGGLVFEPLIDLCHLMNRLVNNQHEMDIPFLEVNVRHLTTPEWHLLEAADFNIDEYKEQLDLRRIRYESNKADVLQNRWCKPTLNMHGVVGAHSPSECSRILPMRVTGKFSIRLVPDQELAHVYSAVRRHIQHIARELDMGTKATVDLIDGCEPSVWSTDCKLTKAVMRAVGDVFKREPIATQAIPICLPVASVLRKLINKPVILLPYMKRMDRHHLENESIEEFALMSHCKLCAQLFYELSLLRAKCKCDVIYEYCSHRGHRERLDLQRGNVVEKTLPKRTFFATLFKLRNATRKPKKGNKMNLKKLLALPFKKIGKKQKPKTVNRLL